LKEIGRLETLEKEISGRGLALDLEVGLKRGIGARAVGEREFLDRHITTWISAHLDEARPYLIPGPVNRKLEN
jgi:hypothetical protein